MEGTKIKNKKDLERQSLEVIFLGSEKRMHFGLFICVWIIGKKKQKFRNKNCCIQT